MKRQRHDVRQRGAVAVLVALILVVLIGAAGIVLDLGRLFVAKTELQNAADACALAAARELQRPSTQLVLTRAENAGVTVGNKHRVDFQDKLVEFVRQDITFSASLDGPYVTRGSASNNVRFVRCTREVPGFLPWFMQLLGAVSNTVGATAVAWVQPGGPTCKIPLALCKEDLATLTIGQWVPGRSSAGDGIRGYFNWIDFRDRAGGADDLRKALEGCLDVPTPNIGDPVLGENGMISSAEASWNSRFGILKGGSNPSPETGATCDTTGYAYTSGPDVFEDYVSKREAFVPYQGPDISGYKKRCDYPSGEVGRRLITVPVIDCNKWPNPTFQGWACALMLAPLGSPGEKVAVEYRGMAGDPGVPCSGFGGPGGPGPLVPTLVQ